MKLKLLCTVSALIVLGGCASAPRRMSQLREGHWTARALVKDKQKGRTFIVNLDFNAKRDAATRMDVTTTLGTGVASLVVNSKQVRYLLFDSRRFYFGRPQASVMRPILSIPLDPRWLNNILFELPLNEKGWSCTQKNGFLAECRDAGTSLNITWTRRNGDKRTVFIEHPSASVQINFSAYQPKVESRANLFVLKPPRGFRVMRVR